MLQKIIQVGNSWGVIIPQVLSREIGIKPGDKVNLSKEGKGLVVSKASPKNLARGVNVEFTKSLDEFIAEHEDVLKELAKR